MKLQTLILGLALGAPTSLLAPAAFAITTLQRVQITDGSRIDLMFDGKVGPKQIRTEFFNDTIQLSLTDVAVYPAKITSVSGMDLTKVFAYQYAPKLVRCRLTVKGKAEDYQNRFKVSTTGKLLSLRIDGGQADQVVRTSAHAERASQAPATTAGGPAAAAEPVKVSSEQERMLLEKVMKAEKAEKPAEKPAEKSQERPLERGADKPIALGGARPMPSPLRSIGVLALMLSALAVVAFGVRKARSAPLQGHKGFSGLMNRFAKLNGKPRLIEVVANHYLGPKKNIAVVRIAGRVLVLGVTSESINLITQLTGNGEEATRQLSADPAALDALGEELALESLGVKPDSAHLGGQPKPPGAGATSAGPSVFSDVLGAERSKPAGAPPVNASRLNAPQVSSSPAAGPQAAGAAPGPSARDRIRTRLEGLKQL